MMGKARVIIFDRIVVRDLPGLPGDAEDFRALLAEALTEQLGKGLVATGRDRRYATASQGAAMQLEKPLDDRVLARQLARSVVSTARERIRETE